MTRMLPHDPQGQLLLGDVFAGKQNDRPLDGVFEFPDIAGPAVFEQHVHGQRGEPLDGLAVSAGIFFKEVLGQQRNVFLPVAQRGAR